jgi:hypothetical protein
MFYLIKICSVRLFLLCMVLSMYHYSFSAEDVTQQTLASPAALAALQAPGTVFFTEDFEDGDYNGWFDAWGPPTVVSDQAQAHTGNGALKCVAKYNNDNSSTSSLKYWFHPGYDKTHYRWYVKFKDDWNQGWGMHFCSMYAVQGDNKYNEMGGAGVKPDGDDRFGTGFEPWSKWEALTPPGRMQFYAYWHQMKPDIYDSNNDDIPDTHYWGNTFYPETVIIPERGAWHCMEIMIKGNTVGQSDGEMASWINGQLYQHVTGFNFRTISDLKLKRISLGIYIHNNPQENTAWFDDVALSTGYIGPTGTGSISDRNLSSIKPVPVAVRWCDIELKVTLSRSGWFCLDVFELTGKRVLRETKRAKTAGEHSFTLGIRPGVYVYYLTFGGVTIKGFLLNRR